jgi:predicted proteasome-type protease
MKRYLVGGFSMEYVIGFEVEGETPKMYRIVKSSGIIEFSCDPIYYKVGESIYVSSRVDKDKTFDSLAAAIKKLRASCVSREAHLHEELAKVKSNIGICDAWLKDNGGENE